MTIGPKTYSYVERNGADERKVTFSPTQLKHNSINTIVSDCSQRKGDHNQQRRRQEVHVWPDEEDGG